MSKLIHAVIALLIAVAVLAAVQASAGTPAHSAPADRSQAAFRLPACPTEDSTGCVWDARHRGNHEGTSLLVTPDGTVYTIPHSLAHVLTHPARSAA